MPNLTVKQSITIETYLWALPKTMTKVIFTVLILALGMRPRELARRLFCSSCCHRSCPANSNWYRRLDAQNVPGGKVNILEGHNIGHSKQKKYICTCVLFRTVSEISLFHCTVPKLLVTKRYSDNRAKHKYSVSAEKNVLYYTLQIRTFASPLLL
jgi:hypothetical protein